MAALARITKWFPWALSPIIVNGPMIGAASPRLAVEVSKAGGIGFLPCSFIFSKDSAQLIKLDADLTETRKLLGHEASSTDTQRIGVGFLTNHSTISQFSETALPIVAKHKPAAVWLFAPDDELKPHPEIIRKLKALDNPPRIFIQVGNVTAAREAIEDGADVIISQGIDAGGHQFIRGMGVVSLTNQVRHLLDTEFKEKEVVLLGAGGIVDGRGLAALLALGADGVVMGTRFTVADESIFPDFRKKLVVDTVDGGSSTLKSTFNDKINPNNGLWKEPYDGRSIMSEIHHSHLQGSSLESLQKKLKDDYSKEESTKLINTWAGTGVGMVTKTQPAGEIVKEVREGAKETIKKLASRL